MYAIVSGSLNRFCICQLAYCLLENPIENVHFVTVPPEAEWRERAPPPCGKCQAAKWQVEMPKFAAGKRDCFLLPWH